MCMSSQSDEMFYHMEQSESAEAVKLYSVNLFSKMKSLLQSLLTLFNNNNKFIEI